MNTHGSLAEKALKLAHKAEGPHSYQKDCVDASLGAAYASLAVYYKLLEIEAGLEAILEAIEEDGGGGPPGPPWWRRLIPFT